MRSRLDTVDHAAAVDRALRLGRCGVGGRLPTPPASLEDAVRQVAATWDDRVARRLERFAGVPDGAVVWTRDRDGALHRAVLEGPWRYDDAVEAHDLDLTHVRPCRWEPADPPDVVLASFARGGRNFQRVRAAG